MVFVLSQSRSRGDNYESPHWVKTVSRCGHVFFLFFYSVMVGVEVSLNDTGITAYG